MVEGGEGWSGRNIQYYPPPWEQHTSCGYKNKMIHHRFIKSKAKAGLDQHQ